MTEKEGRRLVRHENIPCSFRKTFARTKEQESTKFGQNLLVEPTTTF